MRSQNLPRMARWGALAPTRPTTHACTARLPSQISSPPPRGRTNSTDSSSSRCRSTSHGRTSRARNKGTSDRSLRSCHATTHPPKMINPMRAERNRVQARACQQRRRSAGRTTRGNFSSSSTRLSHPPYVLSSPGSSESASKSEGVQRRSSRFFSGAMSRSASASAGTRIQTTSEAPRVSREERCTLRPSTGSLR